MASFQVPANVNWTNTGLSIKAGRKDKTITINVDAASRWSANPNFGGGVYYDARGWAGRPAGADYKAPNSEEGCLIGNIENTAFYFAFDRGKVTVSPDGKILSLQVLIDKQLAGNILLTINDNAGIGDNQGQMQVLDIKIK